jgi:hypothetical protein
MTEFRGQGRGGMSFSFTVEDVSLLQNSVESARSVRAGFSRALTLLAALEEFFRSQ